MRRAQGRTWVSWLLLSSFCWAGSLASTVPLPVKNRARQRDDVALVGIMCSQMLTVLQVFGLWDLLSVQWPQPFATMVKFAAALTFRLEFLNVGCLGPMTPFAQYTFTAFAFFFLASFMVTLHLLRWLVLRIARVRPRFAHWKPSLVGALGSILMTLFIAVSSAILAPLRCERTANSAILPASRPVGMPTPDLNTGTWL